MPLTFSSFLRLSNTLCTSQGVLRCLETGYCHFRAQRVLRTEFSADCVVRRRECRQTEESSETLQKRFFVIIQELTESILL